MSKKLMIIALMAVLTLGASISQATPSRMNTLGQGTGLVYLQDDTNIFTNPATVGAYRNCALLHMGGDAGDMYALGGVTLGLGEMLTLGIIVGRNPAFEEGLIGGIFGAPADLDSPINPAAAGPGLPWQFNNNWANYIGANPVSLAPIAGYDRAMNWMNPIDLMLAAKFGNMSLGVSWYMASGKHTSDFTDDTPSDSSEEMTTRIQALKVGIAADMGNLAPEIWFHYVPFKVSSTWDQNIAPTSSIERELKGRRFNLGTRIFVKLNDNLTIVPSLEWSNATGDVTMDTNPDFLPTALAGIYEDDLAETYRANMINAGVGINWQNDKVLLATSIGMQYAKSVQELEVDGLAGTATGTAKWLALPVVGMGIEYQATKIVVFRGGLSTTTIYGKTTETVEADTALSLDPEDESTISGQNTTAAVGLGLHFGNLVVDVTAGNLLVAGEPSTFSLFSALDAKYKF